jgi:magnesium chelatase family protein
MPVARIGSAALWGVEAHPVLVEVDVSPGLPVLTTVGLPDSAVRESRVRVKSAIQNSGFDFPMRRVAVNLAPADLPKQGTGLDLPIALAVLAASGQIDPARLEGIWAYGELSLEGGVRPTPGALPVLVAARSRRLRAVLLPEAYGAAARLVPGVDPWPIRSLAACAEALRRDSPAPPPGADSSEVAGSQRGAGGRSGGRAGAGAAYAAAECSDDPDEPDLVDVRGQPLARRLLEIAAAGGHSLLMMGPPGAGKTMLARRLPGLLPDLDPDEALEVSCVYSVADPERLRAGPLRRPPFRAPHHTASLAALVGGGADPRPGEISLAHRGVLFLDELSEFRPHVLESLRQPLEEGEVRLSRHRRSLRFPARPILIAALNPCPCGFRGDPVKPCSCPPAALARHRRTLSGPLLDRIDLQVELPRPGREAWEAAGEGSAAVRRRVARAREWMRSRRRSAVGEDVRPCGGADSLNARISHVELIRLCRLGREAQRLLAAVVDRFALSPRVRLRIMRVARTIADLDGFETVLERHVAEAVQYRTTLQL